MGRSYTQRIRAQQQEDTRQRIVEATVALHQTIGGPATTIRAIADKAGVERATVYRHFPDERSLLQACTGHYLAQHPPPDPQSWLAIPDPRARLCAALTGIYAYHRATEVMMARAVIDIPQMPTLAEVLTPMFAYWQQVRDLLATGWDDDADASPLRTAAIGHAIAFTTWQSLVREQGLADATAVNLMHCMVCCAASGHASSAA